MSFRESFLSCNGAPQFEVVETELGLARAYVMTLGEKDAFDVAHAKADGKYFRPRLLAAALRDEDGRPLFTEADFPRLESMPITVVEPFVKAIVRVNRMGDDYAEATRKN